MTKYKCSGCLMLKKVKFFSLDNNRELCDKCINKTSHTNNNMIQLMEKKSKIQLNETEKKCMSLSYEALKQVKQKQTEDKEIREILNSIDKYKPDEMKEILSLYFTEDILTELVEYFITINHIKLRCSLMRQQEQSQQEQQEQQSQ